MIRKLIALSTVLGAAAVLSNKARRERLFGAAKELMQSARAKSTELAEKASDKVDSMSSSGSNNHSSSSTASSTTRPSTSPYTRPGNF